MNAISTQVKLQVPMPKSARDALEKYAEDMGFDSAQAYIRFIAKSVADGRKVDLGEDVWGQPSPAAAKRLNKAAEEAKQGIDVSEPFYTVEEFMKALK